MSRNRFELLLRFLHFNNNEENNSNNRLPKIIYIMNHLNNNFKKYYNPHEILCVNESLVPFRGRIVFRQYINKNVIDMVSKFLNYVVGQATLIHFKSTRAKTKIQIKYLETNRLKLYYLFVKIFLA